MSRDAYDLKLLAEVQAQGNLSQSELAERVHLSTAAVSRRLKRMAADGVIQGYTAIVAPEALGYHQTIIANVEIDDERIDLIESVQRKFLACPQVQQCYYVTGEWDFVLVCIVRDMEQYTELTRELFFDNPNVKRFKTLVTMNRIKTGVAVPVDGLPAPAGVPNT